MFKKAVKSIIVGAAISSAALLPSTSWADIKELNFGIISTESSQNLRKTWTPFLEDMGNNLCV